MQTRSKVSRRAIQVAALAAVAFAQQGRAQALDAALLWRASLQGDIFCKFGDPDCNPCTNDVEHQFDLLTRGVSDKHTATIGVRYDDIDPPWDDTIPEFPNIAITPAHFQGIARIPFAGIKAPEANYWGIGSPYLPSNSNGGWYAISLGNEGYDQPAGLAITWVADTLKNGDKVDSSGDGKGQPMFWYPAPDLPGTSVGNDDYEKGRTHIGGISGIGKYVAVAVDRYSKATSLDILDISRAWSIIWAKEDKNWNADTFMRIPIGASGATRTASVGATKLANGQYLMASTYSTSFNCLHGCGVNFFAGPSLDSKSNWNSRGTDADAPVGEATSLINECKTGRIYMIQGRGVFNVNGNVPIKGEIHESLGAPNVWELSRLDVSGAVPKATSVKIANTPDYDEANCQTRGPSSAYVDEDGALVLLCHKQHPPHDDPSKWRMAEFKPIVLGEIVQQ
jgi:hypothetical protein